MMIVFYGHFCRCIVGTVFNWSSEIGLMGANAIPHVHMNYTPLGGFSKLLFSLSLGVSTLVIQKIIIIKRDSVVLK